MCLRQVLAGAGRRRRKTSHKVNEALERCLGRDEEESREADGTGEDAQEEDGGHENRCKLGLEALSTLAGWL